MGFVHGRGETMTTGGEYGFAENSVKLAKSRNSGRNLPIEADFSALFSYFFAN